MTIQEVLDQARSRIAVDDDELEEAKRRRKIVKKALKKEFGGRVYFNGSLAHGDANDPLTDFDIGIVVPNLEGEYGPGAKSADELKERAKRAIREALEEEFPDLCVDVAGRKRSIRIRFSSPVSDRAVDFTGDVIIGLDHQEEGLCIPRYQSWDRSHPEKHTELIHEANEDTNTTFARTIRLLKHWSNRHDAPLCSWHIKALALGAITSAMPLIDSLQRFFEHSDASLKEGDTPDPADIGPDIKPRVGRTHARDRLATAIDLVGTAKTAEAEGRPVLAQAKLANLLPDIVDEPSENELADEEREHELKSMRAAGNLAGVGLGSKLSIPNTRGWGCG